MYDCSEVRQKKEQSAEVAEAQLPENKLPSKKDVDESIKHINRLLRRYKSLKQPLSVKEIRRRKFCAKKRAQKLRKQKELEKNSVSKVNDAGNPLLSNTVKSDEYWDRFKRGLAPWWQIPISKVIADQIAFDENLVVSTVKDCFCLNDVTSDELSIEEFNTFGEFSLNIEYENENFYISSHSQIMNKDGLYVRGHNIVSVYDNYLKLLDAKRIENDFMDNLEIKKSLHIRLENHELIAVRKSEVADKLSVDRGVVNWKSGGYFLLDGGIFVLMRYMVLTRFEGEMQCWTMNLKGEILKCIFKVYYEKTLILNGEMFPNVCVRKTTDAELSEDRELSETYFSIDGRILLHVWNRCQYVIHINLKKPIEIVEEKYPKLELTWTSDRDLWIYYNKEKDYFMNSASEYLARHREITESIMDYMLCLLHLKPNNVLEFTREYFQKLHCGGNTN